MRAVRLAAVVVMLALAPGQKVASVGIPLPQRATLVPVPAVAGTAPAARAPSSPGTPPIPGGGRILYSTDHGVGVVEADGRVSRFGRWSTVDAFWDPVHPGDILANPFGDGPPRLRQYRRSGDRWRMIRSWPVGYGTGSQISPDGRWFAYDVFEKGMATGTVRVASRHAIVASISGHLSSISWTPGGRVIVGRWDGSGPSLWDPFRQELAPFTLDRNLASRLPAGARRADLDVSRLSWSANGSFFAAPVSWREHGKFRAGVAVGSVPAGVLKVIHTGRGWTVPTWSPTRSEIAFVSSRRYQDPAAALHRYDATRGRQRVLLRGVAEPYWVAWSPGGEWMLLDDAERTRWLFVSRDGARTVDYPWMGSFPRWAGPGFSLHIFVC